MPKLRATPADPAARLAPGTRWVEGAIFVVFGIGKFTAHATEATSFRDYGLPCLTHSSTSSARSSSPGACSCSPDS